MKSFRTALLNVIKSRSSKRQPLTDTESAKACDEAEENLLEEEEEEVEIEQERNSRSWIKRCACCCTTSPRKRLQELRKGIVKSLKDLVFFMR